MLKWASSSHHNCCYLTKYQYKSIALFSCFIIQFAFFNEDALHKIYISGWQLNNLNAMCFISSVLYCLTFKSVSVLSAGSLFCQVTRCLLREMESLMFGWPRYFVVVFWHSLYQRDFVCGGSFEVFLFLHNTWLYMCMPKSVLLTKVHETVWTEVQQRRPCAVYQVALRASDHPQTGDQHDARPSSPTYQPPQVRMWPHFKKNIYFITAPMKINTAVL